MPALRRGLIGTEADRTGDIVAVVDPNLVDMPALQRDLGAAVADQPAAVGVRVQAGCHGAADLHEVHRFMPDEFRLLSRSSFSWSLRIATSTWRVCSDDEVASAVLKARFGDLVDIRRGCVPGW